MPASVALCATTVHNATSVVSPLTYAVELPGLDEVSSGGGGSTHHTRTHSGIRTD